MWLTTNMASILRTKPFIRQPGGKSDRGVTKDHRVEEYTQNPRRQSDHAEDLPLLDVSLMQSFHFLLCTR